MSEGQPGLRVRRVTEAEIEDWLGIRPGERLTVGSEAFTPPHRLSQPAHQVLRIEGIVFSSLGTLMLILGLLDFRGAYVPLTLGIFYLSLGLLFALASVLLRRLPPRPAPQRVFTADGSGVTVSVGGPEHSAPWADLHQVDYVSGPFEATAWPEAKGSGWQCTFAGTAPRTLWVHDEASGRLIAGLRRIMDARRHGCLLPGEPDPPDLSIPAGALSPVSLEAPAERGLSRAQDEPDG